MAVTTAAIAAAANAGQPGPEKDAQDSRNKRHCSGAGIGESQPASDTPVSSGVSPSEAKRCVYCYTFLQSHCTTCVKSPCTNFHVGPLFCAECPIDSPSTHLSHITVETYTDPAGVDTAVATVAATAHAAPSVDGDLTCDTEIDSPYSLQSEHNRTQSDRQPEALHSPQTPSPLASPRCSITDSDPNCLLAPLFPSCLPSSLILIPISAWIP